MKPSLCTYQTLETRSLSHIQSPWHGMLRSRKLCRCCPHLARLIASGYLDCRDSLYSLAITRIPIPLNCLGIRDQVFFSFWAITNPEVVPQSPQKLLYIFHVTKWISFDSQLYPPPKANKSKTLAPRQSLFSPVQFVSSCKSAPTSNTHLAVVEPRIHGDVHVHLAINCHL